MTSRISSTVIINSSDEELPEPGMVSRGIADSDLPLGRCLPILFALPHDPLSFGYIHFTKQENVALEDQSHISQWQGTSIKYDYG